MAEISDLEILHKDLTSTLQILLQKNPFRNQSNPPFAEINGAVNVQRLALPVIFRKIYKKDRILSILKTFWLMLSAETNILIKIYYKYAESIFLFKISCTYYENFIRDYF